MPDDQQQAGEHATPLVARVRALVAAFLETDLVRLRIEDSNADAVEFHRASGRGSRDADAEGAAEAVALIPPLQFDAIKSDLVGIFHFNRPVVRDGEMLENEREIAYVEALGIRNPVRSLGAGRIVGVRCGDGQAVEYGQVLFEIDRGH